MPERRGVWGPLYQRLGRRYLGFALFVTLSGGWPTGVVATAGTALYIDMSVGEFVRLVLASWSLIWLPEILAVAWISRRGIAPITSWLDGAREGRQTRAAWEAAADLPFALARHPLPYLAALPGIPLWGLYATDQLDLPGYAVFVFFAASVSVYLYWVAIRFLGMELALRPLLEDIGASLPAHIELEPVRIRLRWRLLASLVAVTVVTGIAVGGFAASGEADIRALGWALFGTAVTGVVVSSWLIGLLSTSVTRPIARLAGAAEKIGQGDFAARVPLASTDESADLTQAFNQMAAGLEQRERLREAFGTFVDPDLTERVLAEGTNLEGEEVELSILFMDIRDFTTYAEEAEPQEVVARLNDLYGRIVPVIQRHEGHANKFIGDGLLAVFGAPNRLTDHADRAVRAGLEIAASVREHYHGDLRVGVGINSGRVVAGTIGGGGRLDFTVFGDVVNTAARVEGATRQTNDDILITAETKRRLSDGAGWQERPAMELKGKSEQVALFAPVAAAGEGT